MEKQLNIAQDIAYFLDSRFELFGLRFGLNAIFELIPGIGDSLATLFSFYIIFLGIQKRVPISIVLRMIWNICFTFLIGLLPLVGDAFYIFYKPNMRNVKLLKEFSSA